MGKTDIAEEDWIIVRCAQLYYEEGKEQQQVAEHLNISRSMVSKYLARGRERGIIKIKIDAPHISLLALELMRNFKLKDVSVFSLGKPEEPEVLKRMLGAAAARYLENISKDGDSVGIGGGQTMFHMGQALAPQAKKVDLYPLVSGGRTLEALLVQPNIMLGILWLKFKGAKAFMMQVPPFEGSNPQELANEQEAFLKRPSIKRLYDGACDVDIAITSVGAVHPGETFVKLVERSGLSISYGELKRKGVVSDMNLQAFDSKGQLVEGIIEKTVVAVPLDRMREMAFSPQKRVIVVAGGEQKIEPLKAALRRGLFNVLITDEVAAQGLLKSSA